jgi:hypothetical protein
VPLFMDVHEITGGVAMDRVALAQACLEVPGHDVTGTRCRHQQDGRGRWPRSLRPGGPAGSGYWEWVLRSTSLGQ